MKWIVYMATASLKMLFGPEGSTTCSRESFTGIMDRAKGDIRAQFGEYAQVHVAFGAHEKNGPKERTVAAIALCGTGNEKGWWWFYNVKTQAAFIADRWTSLPLPHIIIELLNQMYDRDEPARSKGRGSSEAKTNNQEWMTRHRSETSLRSRLSENSELKRM